MVTFHRIADVDPAPVDPGILERVGVVENLRLREVAPEELPPGLPRGRRRGPDPPELFLVPSRYGMHEREAVPAGDDDVYQRFAALQHLHAVVDGAAVILGDDRGGGHLADRRGDVPGFGTHAVDEDPLLVREGERKVQDQRGDHQDPGVDRRLCGDLPRTEDAPPPAGAGEGRSHSGRPREASRAALLREDGTDDIAHPAPRIGNSHAHQVIYR